MTRQQSLQTLATVFHLLSDETRLRLLRNLQGGERHVTDLCERLGVAQPTVSHHLALLRVHGLVKNRRQGKAIYYSINPVMFKKAGEMVRATLASMR